MTGLKYNEAFLDFKMSYNMHYYLKTKNLFIVNTAWLQ